MQTALAMQEAGVEMIEVRQSYQQLSAACKELERLIVAHRLDHGSNPVLRWQASNLVIMQDTNGNIKPDRKKSTGSIDGMMTLIMALGLEMRVEEKPVFFYSGMGG
jgi:phage terminase large subunit-like protein